MNTHQKVDIDDKIMIFRIARTFSRGMSDAEILKITRRAWKVGERRNKADYALAVVHDQVVAAFTIRYWQSSDNEPGRWEFEGVNAPDAICEKYVGKNVADYFKSGQTNPVLYINC